MAIHISEIGVRLVVGNVPAPATGPAAQRAPAPAAGGTSAAIPPDRMDELVSSCTQRVLETLRAQEER